MSTNVFRAPGEEGPVTEDEFFDDRTVKVVLSEHGYLEFDDDELAVYKTMTDRDTEYVSQLPRHDEPMLNLVRQVGKREMNVRVERIPACLSRYYWVLVPRADEECYEERLEFSSGSFVQDCLAFLRPDNIDRWKARMLDLTDYLDQ